MHVVEIEAKLAEKIDELAQIENLSFDGFVNLHLRESVEKLEKDFKDQEKIDKFIKSYTELPQQSDEYEIWQDEQVWEDE